MIGCFLFSKKASVPSTKSCYEDLKDELHKLKTVDRPHVINQIDCTR